MTTRQAFWFGAVIATMLCAIAFGAALYNNKLVRPELQEDLISSLGIVNGRKQ